jgi:hypothetical protein
MTGINTYTVKKGFYNEVNEVEIYVPSSAVFIKDNIYCGDGLHEGHYHFLGIAPYKDFYEFMKYMDDEDKSDYIGCQYYLGKDWVLFEIKNVDDNNQFNTVSVEKFNSICDFSKYCIGAFKDGELMIMRKIKCFNSLYDIEVIDAEPHCLEKWSVDLHCLFFNNIRKYRAVTKKSNVINMYWKQMVYNALTNMGIPCNKAYNKNIDMDKAKYLYDTIINFNCTDEDIALYGDITNFKKYVKLE